MVLVQGAARARRRSPAWSYAKGGDNCVTTKKINRKKNRFFLVPKILVQVRVFKVIFNEAGGVTQCQKEKPTVLTRTVVN